MEKVKEQAPGKRQVKATAPARKAKDFWELRPAATGLR